MCYKHDNGFLGILLFFSPDKWGVLFCKAEEWCCNDRKVFAKHAMVPCASQESLYLFEVVEGPRIFSKSSNFGRVHCNAIFGYLYPKEVLKPEV
jgi:hypothetical protein